MSSGEINLPLEGGPTWREPVASAANLPVSGNAQGDARVTLDTSNIWVWDGFMWNNSDTPGAVTAIGAFNGAIPSANGATITGSLLFMQSADATHPGLVDTTTQTFAGNKTFIGTITAANFTGSSSGTNTGDVTLGTANGLSLAGQVLSLGLSSASTTGALSSTDWNTFNNKQNTPILNFITNPGAEIDLSGWSLYNNSGNTANAFVVAQDITFTAVAAGSAGNGINIEYIFHPTQSYTTPLVTVLSSTHITVAWFNGPTLANNPTATQLKTAFDAVPAAVAIATSVISGTASNLQYITGSNILAHGGDTAPTTGTGGIPIGVTLTRNTATPLVGVASFDLGKDASNRQGQGLSTDFVIDAASKGSTIEISFLYKGLGNMVFGAASDVQIFVYDITNSVLLPVTPISTLAGPISTIKSFEGQFAAASNSVNYRLIFHIATANALSWDLLLDSVKASAVLNASAQSLVLLDQPISAAVTDHMAVAWIDGANKWVPATSSFNGDALGLFGFATNIIGLSADIYIRGYLDGFHFGPTYGYNEYVDPSTPGALTTNPIPNTDTYLIMGKAISPTAMDIQPFTGFDLVTSKGGILTNSGANAGAGDQVLAVGANGTVPVANSAATLGINWAPAVVVAAPFTYTTATRTLALASQTQNLFLASPNGSSGVPTFRAIVAADIPTLNQNTTGSAAKWTTARLLAGNSVDGSANVPFANKFVVQGTTDAGLSNAQFLGALGTGIVKNTTTTGVLSIAVAADFPTLNQNTTGSAATFTGSLAGDVTGTQGATVIASTTVTGKLITGFVSGAGVVAATDTILQAINKLNGNIALKAPLASPVFTGDVNVSTGNLLISTIGKGLQVKTGANAKIGTAVLVAGTVTVANTSVTANSRIFLTSNVDGGAPGWLRVSAKTNGVSFVITSSNPLDTSTVAWLIVESIP